MTLGRDAVRGLIPHSGAMCLLDTVESWDAERVVCTTAQHRSPENPLRHRGRLSAVHGIEFAAQAMAVHGALIGPPRAAPPFGLLVGVRHCRFHCATLDDVEGALHIAACRLAGSSALLVYEFALSSGDRQLVDGRASVFLGEGAGP